MVQYLNPEGAAPAQGLYSHATRIESGPLYFVSGQLAVGANGEVVGKNDFEKQFRQVFENLADVLRGLGSTFMTSSSSRPIWSASSTSKSS